MKELCMIFCENENKSIGYRGELLYKFKEDMEFFKQVTKGHIVIMGFKTYKEIGRPLPERVNIVVVNFNYPLPEFHEDIIVVRSLEDAYEKARNYEDKKAFIIGGEKLYQEAMDNQDVPVNTVYMTLVEDCLEGDVSSPVISNSYRKDLLYVKIDENVLDGIYYTLLFFKVTLKKVDTW